MYVRRNETNFRMLSKTTGQGSFPWREKNHQKSTCPFRKLCPDVMVVQSGQDRDGNNGTGALDRPTQGRILAQCKVRADLIVVRCISRKNLPQVRRTKDSIRSRHSRRTVPIKR